MLRGHDKRFERDLWQIIKKIKAAPSHMKDPKRIDRVLRRGGNVVAQAMREAAPERASKWPGVVKRWDGSGNVRASFARGNLKRSIKVFRLSGGIFIGPRIHKRERGHYSGSRASAYYAPFVEYGFIMITRSRIIRVRAQPFARPGWNSSKIRSREVTLNGLEREANRYFNKVAVKAA